MRCVPDAALFALWPARFIVRAKLTRVPLVPGNIHHSRSSCCPSFRRKSIAFAADCGRVTSNSEVMGRKQTPAGPEVGFVQVEKPVYFLIYAITLSCAKLRLMIGAAVNARWCSLFSRRGLTDVPVPAWLSSGRSPSCCTMALHSSLAPGCPSQGITCALRKCARTGPQWTSLIRAVVSRGTQAICGRTRTLRASMQIPRHSAFAPQQRRCRGKDTDPVWLLLYPCLCNRPGVRDAIAVEENFTLYRPAHRSLAFLPVPDSQTLC